MSHGISVSLVIAAFAALSWLAGLLGFFGFVVAVHLATSPAAAKKPNILWLHADDPRPDTIAALGNPAVLTP
jgi:hypothetical protein